MVCEVHFGALMRQIQFGPLLLA